MSCRCKSGKREVHSPANAGPIIEFANCCDATGIPVNVLTPGSDIRAQACWGEGPELSTSNVARMKRRCGHSVEEISEGGKRGVLHASSAWIRARALFAHCSPPPESGATLDFVGDRLAAKRRVMSDCPRSR